MGRTITGCVAAQQGEFEKAEQRLAEAKELARNAELPGLELFALALLRAWVLVPLGRENEGQRRLEELVRERLKGKCFEDLAEFLEPAEKP